MFDQATFKNQVETALAALPGADLSSISGVTTEQISDLDAQLGHPLPKAIAYFLTEWGANPGEILNEYGVTYPRILKNYANRDEINKVLGFAGEPLKSEHLVLDYHLSAELLYLDLTEGEDPPVYMWAEGEGGIEDGEHYHDSFSAFILFVLDLKAKYLKMKAKQA